MDDDSRLPPGRTLRLTLLDGAIHVHFRAVAHPAASGCGACHRPWKKHKRRQRGVVMSCTRCGIEFYDTCYSRWVTSPQEWEAFWSADDDGEKYLFLCAGCRS